MMNRIQKLKEENEQLKKENSKLRTIAFAIENLERSKEIKEKLDKVPYFTHDLIRGSLYELIRDHRHKMVDPEMLDKWLIDLYQVFDLKMEDMNG